MGYGPTEVADGWPGSTRTGAPHVWPSRNMTSPELTAAAQNDRRGARHRGERSGRRVAVGLGPRGAVPLGDPPRDGYAEGGRHAGDARHRAPVPTGGAPPAVVEGERVPLGVDRGAVARWGRTRRPRDRSPPAGSGVQTTTGPAPVTTCEAAVGTAAQNVGAGTGDGDAALPPTGPARRADRTRPRGPLERVDPPVGIDGHTGRRRGARDGVEARARGHGVPSTEDELAGGDGSRRRRCRLRGGGRRRGGGGRAGGGDETDEEQDGTATPDRRGPGRRASPGRVRHGQRGVSVASTAMSAHFAVTGAYARRTCHPESHVGAGSVPRLPVRPSRRSTARPTSTRPGRHSPPGQPRTPAHPEP